MDYIEIIVNILLAAGVVSGLAAFGYKKLKKLVEGTKTMLDDVILDFLIRIANIVLDEKDLGKFGELLKKILEGAKDVDEETTELEKQLEKGIDNLKKN